MTNLKRLKIFRVLLVLNVLGGLAMLCSMLAYYEEKSALDLCLDGLLLVMFILNFLSARQQIRIHKEKEKE